MSEEGVPMSKTRTLYAASEQMLKSGMVPYVYYAWWDLLTPVSEFSTSPDEMLHYEVSRPPGALGSWWLPVGLEFFEYWERAGGITPLKVESGSDMVTRQEQQALVLRPKHLLYWIPDVFWELSGLGPGQVRGLVKGRFPLTGPVPEQPSRARFEHLDSEEHPVDLNGVRFTVELPKGVTVQCEHGGATLRLVTR